MHVDVAVQQYSKQFVFKYMNSNEGLKYEFYTKYCFIHCCNNLPEKVQSPCRPITPYIWSHTLKLKKELVLILSIFLSFFLLVLAVLLFFSLSQALSNWEKRNEKTP